MSYLLGSINKHVLWVSALVSFGSPAFAGPSLSFALDQISDPLIGSGTLGTVNLTQISSTVVDVQASFSPLLVINSGGPHTPFAFNTSLTSLTISFISPAGGVGTQGTFTFNSAGGFDTPYGTFSEAIDYSAGNGSSSGYSGLLEFTVSRGAGISTTDFTANAGGFYFAADLSNGNNTGSVATLGPVPVGVPVPSSVPVRVPEPSSAAVLVAALLSIVLFSRRKLNSPVRKT